MNTSLMDVDSADDHLRARPRVNGRLLAQRQGDGVCLLGRVLSCPTASSLLVEAADSLQVRAALSRDFFVEPGTVVEVLGTATSDKEIAVSHIVLFDRDNIENFDMEVYNKAVEICNGSQAFYLKP